MNDKNLADKKLELIVTTESNPSLINRVHAILLQAYQYSQNGKQMNPVSPFWTPGFFGKIQGDDRTANHQSLDTQVKNCLIM